MQVYMKNTFITGIKDPVIPAAVGSKHIGMVIPVEPAREGV
jgi:hypothetical protein